MVVRRSARILVMASAVLWLAGCEYLDRRETVSLHAGNAVASNLAVHTIDPWPYEAANQQIPGDGRRAATIMERYRTGKVTPPQDHATSQISGSDGGQ
jgi:type IV pilus biogenesis protein CpaD/CtpE